MMLSVILKIVGSALMILFFIGGYIRCSSNSFIGIVEIVFGAVNGLVLYGIGEMLRIMQASADCMKENLEEIRAFRRAFGHMFRGEEPAENMEKITK